MRDAEIEHPHPSSRCLSAFGIRRQPRLKRRSGLSDCWDNDEPETVRGFQRLLANAMFALNEKGPDVRPATSHRNPESCGANLRSEVVRYLDCAAQDCAHRPPSLAQATAGTQSLPP